LVLPLEEKDAMLDDEDNLDFNQANEEVEGNPEDEDERISTMADKRMHVISLQSLPSTTSCTRVVKNFVKSKTRRIISSLSPSTATFLYSNFFDSHS
jgi:hypothetical protein